MVSIETSPSYYRARYYDPQDGRFLSEDSVGFGAGINFYSYVSQSPTNFVDPSGHQEGVAVGAGIGCAVGPGGCAVGAGVGAAVDALQGIAAGAGLAYYAHKACKSSSSHNDDDCDDLLRKIYQAMNEIDERIVDLLLDLNNLYAFAYATPNPTVTKTNTTYRGHIQQAQDVQQRLRNLLNQAILKGCPIPPAAWKWATKPVPTRPWPKK